MELKSQETPDGVKVIALSGRMDIAGTQEIDLRFTNIASSHKSLVVVDIAEVSFLASIGMRTLVSSARALMNRGGAMALVRPQPLVQQALVAAGIDSLIPIYPDVGEASRELRAAHRA